MDSVKASSGVRKKFQEGLGSIDLSGIKHTDESFQKLAKQALYAGNITEKEYAEALKGTISPMQLMETAAQGAADNLNALAAASDKAIAEEEKAAREKAEAETGIDTEVVDLKMQQLANALGNTTLIEKGANDLFAGMKDSVIGLFDNTDVSSMIDVDSKGNMAVSGRL